MIHKIIPSVAFNYWLKRSDTQLNEPTNQNLIKCFESTNKKTLLLSFRTSVLNSPMSPPSLS